MMTDKEKNKVQVMLVAISAIIIGAAGYWCTMRFFKTPFGSARFDHYIADTMERFHVPGLALAIIKDDVVVHCKGYGVIEYGTATPVDTHTIFPIGSCTKAFTAAALGILVDDKIIAWNDAVFTHIPELRLYDDYITKHIMISDILSHRSGIEDNGLLYYRTHFLRDDLVKKLSFLEAQVPFRVSGVYSNLMYLLAGQIIPATTKKDWNEFIEQRLLMPLEMKESSTTLAALSGKMNVAQPHIFINDGVVRIPFLNIDNVAPAGAINSTISDMTHWACMMLNKGMYKEKLVMSEQSVDAMHSPQSIMAKWHPYGLYGFGWGLSDHDGYKMVSHKGNIDGMSAIVGLLPDKKLGVVVLCNMHDSAIGQCIVNDIFDYYGGYTYAFDAQSARTDMNYHMHPGTASGVHAPVQQQSGPVRVKGTKPSLLNEEQAYVGRYRNDFYEECAIFDKDGSLWCRFLGFEGVISHWNDDTFVFDSSQDYPAIGDKFFLKFNIKNNKVSSVAIKISGDKDAIFKKIK